LARGVNLIGSLGPVEIACSHAAPHFSVGSDGAVAGLRVLPCVSGDLGTIYRNVFLAVSTMARTATTVDPSWLS
jgi:hypothetical protein